jgi:CheY-like chemotaxis protein
MSSKHCVLVVEDDIDGAAVLDWMLKTEQTRTVIVSSAEEALEEVSAHPTTFNAIIIDLALPQMDGFELLSHVKKRGGKPLPTIAITAFHTPELRQKALNVGFDAYVPKPLDKDVLLKALNQVLS